MSQFKFYTSIILMFLFTLSLTFLYPFADFIKVILVLLELVAGIVLLVDIVEYQRLFALQKEGKFSIVKSWLTVIMVFILCGIFFGGKTMYTDSKEIYNTSIDYQNEYTKLCQEKQGFYDNLWKSYYQKTQITNMNKETFLQVTKMIMDGRSDGQNVSWKWVQENQQIPYSEFTKFYSDLSVFIETRRDSYLEIEKKCQELAKKNNVMLDTFPNNIYNRYLDCPHIKFEYGFLSDKTEQVFKTKKENLD